MSVSRVCVQADRDGDPVAVDVALPSGASVADLLPALVELVDERIAPDGAARRWRLNRLAGGSLEESLSLTDNGVQDGEFLILTPDDAPIAGTLAPVRVPAGQRLRRPRASRRPVPPRCGVRPRHRPGRGGAGLDGRLRIGDGECDHRRRGCGRRRRSDDGHRLPHGAEPCGGVPRLRNGIRSPCRPAPGDAERLLGSHCRGVGGTADDEAVRARVAGTDGNRGLVGAGGDRDAGADAALQPSVRFSRPQPSPRSTLAPRLSVFAAGLGPDRWHGDLTDRALEGHAILSGLVAGCTVGAVAGALVVAAAENTGAAGVVTFTALIGAVLLLRARTHVEQARRITLLAGGLASIVVAVCASPCTPTATASVQWPVHWWSSASAPCDDRGVGPPCRGRSTVSSTSRWPPSSPPPAGWRAGTPRRRILSAMSGRGEAPARLRSCASPLPPGPLPPPRR